MKRNPTIAAACMLAASVLAGCGRDATELTPAEQAAFKGAGTGGARTSEAAKGIGDFKKNWEAKHGKAGAAPPRK